MLEALQVLLSHTNNPFDISGAISSYCEAIELISDELVGNTELTDALDDLYNTAEEAHEEGFPIPSDLAISNSEALVRKIYGIFPSRFEVYPRRMVKLLLIFTTEGQAFCILLCDSAGAILCMVNINGHSRRAHYTQVDMLPDGFVKEALQELSA